MYDMSVRIGGMALVAIAGLATACPPGEESCDTATEASSVWFGSFGDEPVQGELSTAIVGDGGQWVGDLGGLRGFFFAGQDEGISETIQIISENGKTRVIRNGKELSDEEVAKLHDHLGTLHGAHGAAGNVFSLRVEPSTGADGKLALKTRVVGPDDDLHFDTATMQPKVMVGITMAEPDESLRAHLGIGDRQVIMLDGVIDGLPAAKAGLKKYDIIVAIDDNDDQVTAEHLHKVLMSKQPGDELKLRVLRGGEKETYRVKLSAYDAKSLGAEKAPQAEQVVIDERRAAENKVEHMARLKEMTSRLREAGLDEEKIAGIQRQVEDAIKQAMEQSERAMVRSRQAAPGRQDFEFMVPGPDGRVLGLKLPDMQNMQVPDALRDRLSAYNSGASPDLERRMADLERRMDEVSARLEARMERALSRFEEMTERLDKKLREGGE